MKCSTVNKLVFSVWLVFSLGNIRAQEIPTQVTTQARLDNVLVLKMTPEKYVKFGIKKINENLYQITRQPDDVLFSVESTGNWNLAINAEEPYFTGEEDSTHKVPVDFIGLFIENIGSNWDNGLFSNMANATKDTVVALSPERTNLIESGVRGNIGSSEQNAFILRWKFYYEDDVLKTRKFSDYNINDDTYKVGYFITLSESTANHKKDQ